jgi:D-alanyl-D-alanine carboxypeptidase/D-alanyl-D-alanine-endopeptidase (penicillin-binding protein 4)
MVIVATTLLATLVAASLFTPPSADATETDRQIASAVGRLVGVPSLGSSVGVHVRNVTTGTSAAAVRMDQGFIPASTMKIVTAYTALRRLGADHRFTTTVYLAEGDHLILEGGGDPVLTSGDLRLLATRTAKSLRKLGVESPVVVDFDDDIFAKPRNAPGWESGDMPTYVSAVRGLGLLGSYATDTARVATVAFVSHLNSRGVSAVLGSRADVGSADQRLARFRGNDVAEAINVMMPPSENNVAEVLFRQVALATGEASNWIGARRAVRKVLRRDGFTIRSSSFVDGSGLSYRNLLTPTLLTDILMRIHTDSRYTVARDSLPVAGVNGTMIRRFAAPPAACARGAIAAKTGSLPMTVSTLAGLTKARDGTTKAFAIMVNNRPSAYAWSQTSAAIDTIAAAVHGCVR